MGLRWVGEADGIAAAAACPPPCRPRRCTIRCCCRRWSQRRCKQGGQALGGNIQHKASVAPTSAAQAAHQHQLVVASAPTPIPDESHERLCVQLQRKHGQAAASPAACLQVEKASAAPLQSLLGPGCRLP
jgi:DNA uptake protein ComE-like DNA-binding protein